MDYPQETIKNQWDAICSKIQQEQGDRFAVRWLSKIIPDKIENNQVCLLVPSPCIHELVKQNYADQILSLWREQNAEVGGLNLKLAPAQAELPLRVTPTLKPKTAALSGRPSTCSTFWTTPPSTGRGCFRWG